MGNELIGVFEQIEREKGIPKGELLVMIESALSSAFRKHSGKKQNFEAHIDSDTGIITAYVKKKVVESVTNHNIHISLKDAKKVNAAVKMGDEVKIEIKTEEFGRMAAQTAKQVIIQRIRETEKENLFKELKDKEATVVNGVVQRITKKNVIVDIGKTEAVLPDREQIKGHNYSIGEHLKVYILRVEATPQGPHVVVSRIHPNLVKSLYDLEVPEIHDNVVEIKKIVREPGIRCKVAVVSHNSRVDPVGACVGVKGSRIQSIINELNGERMDLIPWVDNIEKFIKNSLSPAKVQKVIMDKDKRTAHVTVDDDMLSLSIGKSGQNVRLASRLTGMHIDIKSESQRKEESKSKSEVVIKELTQLPGVGKKTAESLFDYGFESAETIASADVSSLKGVPGIGEGSAKKIIEAAKKMKK